MASYDAEFLRNWALRCEKQAQDARTSGDERDRLLEMRDSLLLVAETQDWLDGNTKDPSVGPAELRIRDVSKVSDAR